MKTILRILTIVLIGILAAGAVYLIVENTSLLSAVGGPSDFERGVVPDGDSQPQARTKGDGHHDETASLSRGLSQVAVSLAKIGGITIVVLFIQTVFPWLRYRLPAKPILGA